MDFNNLPAKDKIYFQDDDVVIYCADNRDILPLIPEKSIDLVLTDPPYGVREDEWDNMSEQEFARFSMGWLSEIRRISENALLFCISDNAIPKLTEMLYTRIRQIIWCKPLGSQYNPTTQSSLQAFKGGV
jgi:DNA modification methylase